MCTLFYIDCNMLISGALFFRKDFARRQNNFEKKSHFEKHSPSLFFQGNPGERGFPGPGGPSGSPVSIEEYLVLFSLILI